MVLVLFKSPPVAIGGLLIYGLSSRPIMTTKANKKTISLVILLTAVIISASLIFYTLRFFIDAFLGSLIFYVLFRKFQRYLTQTRKWKSWLSAIAIILITLLI